MSFIHATFITHIGKDDCENPTKFTDKPFGGLKVPSRGFLMPLGPAWESLRMALTNYCGS